MEYCPVCRKARNMRVSIHKNKEIDHLKGKEIVTKTFHCVICGSFVRSEIVDDSMDSLNVEIRKIDSVINF